jgi:hypothetical protein
MKTALSLLVSTLALAYICYGTEPAPYSARRERVGEHITKNITSGYFIRAYRDGITLKKEYRNGWSYTGLNRLDIETALITSVGTSSDPLAVPPCKVYVAHTGSRRWSIGMTPVGNPDRQEPDRFDEPKTFAVCGIGWQAEF